MTNKIFGADDAAELLGNNFAPWIQDLNIRFEKVADGQAVLRVPASERLNRIGGMICGQAIMSVADTAMVFAISSALNKFESMTTVSQSSSFLRPATDADLIAHASVIKLGRTVVYGDVNLYTTSPDKPVAHITSTYMLV